MDVIVGTPGPRHAASPAPAGAHHGLVPAARAVAVLTVSGGLTTGVLLAISSLVERWS